jgi:hypothetical protein
MGARRTSWHPVEESAAGQTMIDWIRLLRLQGRRNQDLERGGGDGRELAAWQRKSPDRHAQEQKLDRCSYQDSVETLSVRFVSRLELVRTQPARDDCGDASDCRRDRCSRTRRRSAARHDAGCRSRRLQADRERREAHRRLPWLATKDARIRRSSRASFCARFETGCRSHP